MWSLIPVPTSVVSIVQAIQGASTVPHPINTQTASYTLSSTDFTEPETFILMNVGSTNTLTAPSSASSAGGEVCQQALPLADGDDWLTYWRVASKP